MSTFRPITPSQYLQFPMFANEFSDKPEPAKVDELIKWIFSVQSNATNKSSENITALKNLVDAFPESTVDSFGTNMYMSIAEKVWAVFHSLVALSSENKYDSSLSTKVTGAITALKNGFPNAVRTETPSSSSDILCFSPQAQSDKA